MGGDCPLQMEQPRALWFLIGSGQGEEPVGNQRVEAEKGEGISPTLLPHFFPVEVLTVTCSSKECSQK